MQYYPCPYKKGNLDTGTEEEREGDLKMANNDRSGKIKSVKETSSGKELACVRV